MPNIAEIFSSISGEGSWMGRAAIFVRFSGCNLSCEWCDEKHAGKYIELDKVIECVLSMSKKIKRVVITGGEPLLQKEDCISLIEKLSNNGFKIMIETNGTLINKLNSKDTQILKRCELTVSPKKGHVSGNSIRVAKNLFSNFKFVVGSKSWKLEEVKSIVDKYDISGEYVWLMPLTINGEIDDELTKEIWEFCVENGYNYSDRLHVRVWKGEKGR